VAEFAVGGLGVIGIGFLVKVGLDQANKQQKRAHWSEGRNHPTSREDDGTNDWTYIPPSS
jgi:hypothetical protein